MNGLTEAQLAELRTKLQDELTSWGRTLETTDGFGMGESLRESVGELSSYDNHPADSGSDMFERGKDSALREHFRLQQQNAEEALDRMERGDYGLCATCGERIPYERLSAQPAAAYCTSHAPRREIGDSNRPVEEEFLAPPFGRTSLDERDDQNGFDGEDAWQIVESWGNSNTPALAERPNDFSYDHGESSDDDEYDSFVEPLESFLATDLYGRHVQVVRNRAYREYVEHGEGDPLLEPDYARDGDASGDSYAAGAGQAETDLYQ